MNFVFYFEREDWVEESPDDPAVKLFRRYVNLDIDAEEKDMDPLFDRMKIITSLTNPDEAHLGSFEKTLFSKYNAKPFLSRPQHVFFRGPNYFEIDIDVHKFAYLCR